MVATVAALVAALVCGSIAVATIPDGSGVIHTCYSTKTGALRVVDGTPCLKGEAALNWNQTGPQGLPGQNGKDAFGTLWAAATFTLSADGCAANEYKLVVDQTWGNTLSLTDNGCTAATQFGPGGSYGLANTPAATLHVPSDANDLFTDTTNGDASERFNASGGNLVAPHVLRITVNQGPTTTTTVSVLAAFSPTLADFAADVAAGNYKSAPLIISQLPQ